MSLGDSNVSASLETAQGSIRETAVVAVVEASNNLLDLMRSAPTYRERSRLASVQTHLLKTRDTLLNVFASALREKVSEELSPKGQDRAPREPTDWQAVGLVDANQIDERLSFERIGQFISHECEAELRELNAYTGSMLRHGWADPARNPLRGNVIGSALHQAIEKITDDIDMQRILAKEIGQPLAKALPACYRAIIDDLVARGFRQTDLAVRPAAAPVAAAMHAPGFEEARKLWERSMAGRLGTDPGDSLRRWETSMLGRPVADPGDSLRSWESSILGRHGHIEPATQDPATLESSAAFLDRLMRGALPGASARGLAGLVAPASPEADAELMRLLRRLNGDTVRDDLDTLPSESSTARTVPGRLADTAPMPFLTTQSGFGGMMAANLIRAHREELMQASLGRLDHMVIEVVSSLFDQILSDVRVPPQMARQIARLQLPVLRVALRDTSFFSSRKHPVRRFVNRISSLATGFNDFDSGPGRELLDQVGALVTDIVAGDFDQIGLYGEKMLELEAFTAELARAEVAASPAAETLQAKELEWRLQQRFSLRLGAALEPLAVAPYLKEFLSQVWSQVILTAAQRDDAEQASERKYRRAAFDLVVSIQPKRSIEQRSHFLATLPGLMATLNEGLSLIDWPKQPHDTLFGKLFADHAGSLKATPGTELDHNMLLRQLEAAFRTPLPKADDPDADSAAPVKPVAAAGTLEPRFTAEEASSVGLIGEAAVDWSGALVDPEEEEPVAIDVVAAPAVEVPSSAGADPDAFPTIAPESQEVRMPEPEPALGAEPEEPTEGPQLRHHLQLGISYQLQLKDQWEKVRLSYMSPARTLFLFTHGSKDRGTISMTARMLERLCETRRMKTFERGYLIDRATERARKQLAALAPAAGTPGARPSR